DERQLLAGNEAADAEVLDRELVLAVGREDVPGDDAAARAERHALETLTLRGVALREVRRFDRRPPRPDRHADDARGRRRVRLDERWRNRERSGDVVESVRGSVRRQQHRGIDLETKE